VRIGLHTGEPRPTDDGYVGLDVHHAARVMAAGHGGQVLVSEPTRALLGKGVELRDLGEHQLKDLAGPEQLYQLEIDGLPAEFPPLNTLDSRFTNLPTVPNAFVGRERELVVAGELLARDDVRLLTLIGPGGTGKTRLALQLAWAADERFADGAAFVQLAPVRAPELVVPAIAQALDLRDQPGESALETLSEYLRDKELLLVLDNFEQVLAAAPAVASLLAEAPGLKLVATSRTPLHLSGERAYRVPQLALDEAVELFAERAQAAAPDFRFDDENADAVAEICSRLDRMLAIELAAPRVRTLTPQALLRRLDQRLPLLTGGAQDADERQRALRDTIAWSYDLLLERERTLFRQLAVFVGGFRFEAAAAAGGSIDVLEDLDSLVETSLLLRLREDSDGEPRFWMLETIREYALEQLGAAAELESARKRHGAWFAELAECLDAESVTGDQSASMARLADDYPNLRAAIDRAREDRDGELLLRLATALWPFWSTRGYVAEGRQALEDALELAGRRPARALLGRASLRVFSGSSDGLFDDVQEVLRTAEELGDPLTLAQAWNLFGRVEGTILGSLALWRSARAKIRAHRGEHDEAEALAREAVAVVERTDLLNTHGDTLADLGEVVALAGRPSDAVAVYDEAAGVFERKGNLASLERVRVAARGLAR
jgi:predicted ATPase